MEELVAVILTFISAFLLLFVIISVFSIICNWRIYKKAGLEGWESIVPIYNIIVKFKFLNIPLWVLLLLVVPGVGLTAVNIMVSINTSKKFGKGVGFTIGLIFLPLVFNAILAFDDSFYDSSVPGIFEDAVKTNVVSNENLKYCRYCGKPLIGEYCSNCGKKDE